MPSPDNDRLRLVARVSSAIPRQRRQYNRSRK